MASASVDYCPECRAPSRGGRTCQDHFHQMAAWELENPRMGEAHHLMVLCYHLQHPSLYSPEGLQGARRLLVDFLERGLSPQAVRWRDRADMDSGRRPFKIKGTPASHGAYAEAVAWTMTAGDVTAGGPERYVRSVQAWARSVYATLEAAGELIDRHGNSDGPDRRPASRRAAATWPPSRIWLTHYSRKTRRAPDQPGGLACGPFRPRIARVYERRGAPMLPMRAFLLRLLGQFLMALAVAAFSLLLGTAGYHYIEGLSWIDALLNAAMLLGGMGPVNELHTTAGKLFATFYALYSGMIFLVIAGLLLAPVFHRVLHHFHLEVTEDDIPQDHA